MKDTERTIEIQGVKIDVDLREAKAVESYRVGDPVNVLKKKWSDNWEAHAGVIVAFLGFRNLPTIRVMYFDGSELKIEDFNENSNDFEIAPLHDIATLIDRANVEETLEKQIQVKEQELVDLRNKLALFRKQFDRFFSELVEDEPQVANE